MRHQQGSEDTSTEAGSEVLIDIEADHHTEGPDLGQDLREDTRVAQDTIATPGEIVQGIPEIVLAGKETEGINPAGTTSETPG